MQALIGFGDGMKKMWVGEFEQIVLLAILQLEDRAYAVPIRRMIGERAGRRVARGALYTALERLEAKGLVTSRLGEPTPERGGRAKRFFTVTAAGVRVLRSSKDAMLRLWRGLDSVLGRTP